MILIESWILGGKSRSSSFSLSRSLSLSLSLSVSLDADFHLKKKELHFKIISAKNFDAFHKHTLTHTDRETHQKVFGWGRKNEPSKMRSIHRKREIERERGRIFFFRSKCEKSKNCRKRKRF